MARDSRVVNRRVPVLQFDDSPTLLNFNLSFGARARTHRTAGTRSSSNSSNGGSIEWTTAANVSSPPSSDGDPWYRYKKVSDRGEATHRHLRGIVASGVFERDLKSAHDEVRSRAGLQNLAWDPQLEEMATKRVEYLASNGCFIQHSPVSDLFSGPARYDYVGENLYKVIGMRPTGVDVADAWYAEIEDYTYGLVGNDCTKWRCAHRDSPPCTIGHYTQMLWEESTHLGCARAKCPNRGSSEADDETYIAICHYGPGGNRVGEIPFSSAVSGRLGHETKTCDRSSRLSSAMR